MPDLLMKVEVKEESWNDLEAVERLETAEERRKGRKNGGLGGEIRTGRGRGRRRKPRSSILSTSCLPVALSLTPQGHPNLLQNRILLIASIYGVSMPHTLLYQEIPDQLQKQAPNSNRFQTATHSSKGSPPCAPIERD